MNFRRLPMSLLFRLASRPKAHRSQRRSAVSSLSIALLTLLISLNAPLSAAAHEVRPMIATLDAETDWSSSLVISLNLEAVIVGIEPGHDTRDSENQPQYDRLRALSPEALRTEWEAFAPAFLEGIEFAFDDQPADLTLRDVVIPSVGDTTLPRTSELVLSADYPADVQTSSWRLDPRFGDSVFRVLQPGSEELASATYVPAGHSAGPISLQPAEPQSAAEVFGNYTWSGFTHILPKGLDHILFVVGLFLLSTRLSALLWQVSAFTVAHTVTLALGALDLVSIRPEIVEPLIALSIVWIAVENVFTNRLSAWRPLIVFAFGLLHGLGFAGVLGEVGLSGTHFVAGLVGFNIGVELGQLAVIALCYAAVGWAMSGAHYRTRISIPASIVIAVIAGSWTLERTGLI